MWTTEVHRSLFMFQKSQPAVIISMPFMRKSYHNPLTGFAQRVKPALCTLEVILFFKWTSIRPAMMKNNGISICIRTVH